MTDIQKSIDQLALALGVSADAIKAEMARLDALFNMNGKADNLPHNPKIKKNTGASYALPKHISRLLTPKEYGEKLLSGKRKKK